MILPRRARACTCCSGSGTRRTGSRSPTTGRRSKREDGRALDAVPGSARSGARRCSGSSVRCKQLARCHRAGDRRGTRHRPADGRVDRRGAGRLAPEAAPGKAAESPEAAPDKAAESPEAAPDKAAESPEAAPDKATESPEAAPDKATESPEAAQNGGAPPTEEAPSAPAGGLP